MTKLNGEMKRRKDEAKAEKERNEKELKKKAANGLKVMEENLARAEKENWKISRSLEELKGTNETNNTEKQRLKIA